MIGRTGPRRNGGNSRNGHRAKTVLTEASPVQVEVLRWTVSWRTATWLFAPIGALIR